ncbi:hypothetical protein [Bifidobacterium vansinderenii]|uniref:Phage minor structural protein n=1 Tax=Bifidobacterium vansinderenii TaxID=1984871 RepID=A0A229W0Z1_9BIFI|nr:hypothetical protein [Bifidobacterium vansinderenii]OXN01496.1 hypothetical protein Tam10B_0499 [Bifidobacterium vansinderenii]
MSPFEQSLLMWAITGIASGAIGYLLAWLRGRSRRDTAIDDGVRVLLLCELERQQREMVANGGIADNESKSRAQTVYDAYHQLGGNGHGTAVNDDIQRAPIARKP